MLQGINRIGKSWVGRVIVAVLFGFLIVSFAIWGIGDIFRGSVRTQVATVGNVDISAEAFRNAYQTELQALIRRTRRSITPDQARALGLEQRVLARLVSDAVLDNETRRLGLSVPDSLVIRAVQADPSFRGPTGAFDRNLFTDLLRQNGISEAQYVRDQKAGLARGLLAEGITGSLTVPLAMREAVHRYRSERRTVEAIRLGPAVLGAPPAPTEAQIQTHYDERKAAFRAPEYRALNVMVLDPAALAKPEAVTDEAARAYYAQVKDSKFGSPERRALQQIVFPSRPEAEAASARIKSGTPFADIAREREVDEATLDLGTLTRAEMVDPVTADAAFSLREGEVSEPIDGRFGPVLIRVARIEPATQKPFEEVAAEVKAEVAQERARAELQAVHDAIEDQRAGARPLPEIAREKGLALLQIAAVDRSGQDKAGQNVATVPEREALLAAAFRSEVGSDNEAINIPAGGYVWFEVTGVEPAQDQPLAAVRDRVAEDWRRAETARLMAAKAGELAERINRGETAAAVAAELGLTVATVTDLSRGQPKDELGAAIITRIFATPVGKAASAAQDDETRVLFKVTEASVPPFVTTTQESSAVEGQLRTLLADDLLSEFTADVEKRVGVQLYPANVRRAIGGES